MSFAIPFNLKFSFEILRLGDDHWFICMYRMYSLLLMKYKQLKRGELSRHVCSGAILFLVHDCRTQIFPYHLSTKEVIHDLVRIIPTFSFSNLKTTCLTKREKLDYAISNLDNSKKLWRFAIVFQRWYAVLNATRNISSVHYRSSMSIAYKKQTNTQAQIKSTD